MAYQMPADLKAALLTAANAGCIIVIEIEDDGVIKYVNGLSCFGPDPVEDPMLAVNFAIPEPDAFGRDVDQSELICKSLDRLWYEVNSLFIKDEGGGKSAVRSDVPGKIAVFDKPAPPPRIATYYLSTFKDR